MDTATQPRETDAITAAVLTLQAAGWTVVDANGDYVELAHPDQETCITIEFGSPNEER